MTTEAGERQMVLDSNSPAAMEHIKQFLDECTERNDMMRVDAVSLYERYVEWETVLPKPFSAIQFGFITSALDVQKVRTNRGTMYLGIVTK